MINTIKNIIRKIVPAPIINWLYDRWIDARLWVIKKRIIRFLERDGHEFPQHDRELIANWLRKNKIAMMPYEFHVDPASVEVFTDTGTGLKYVMHQGKRMYYIRNRPEALIRSSYANLLTEQLPESPHAYLGKDFEVKAGDVVVDLGASEGIFALSVIDKASKVYLVECEPGWVEALKLTFAPYANKVEIIEKFVSDKADGDRNTTLDEILQGRQVNFVKADIEGAEESMLEGATHTLANTDELKLSLCVYHNEQDAENLQTFLKSSGFDTHFSDGYMILHQDPHLRYPWLRHGVIRATKQNS